MYWSLRNNSRRQMDRTLDFAPSVPGFDSILLPFQAGFFFCANPAVSFSSCQFLDISKIIDVFWETKHHDDDITMTTKWKNACAVCNSADNPSRSRSTTMADLPRPIPLMTRQEEEQLIDLWEMHTCLWDPRDRTYKNKLIRKDSCSRIALLMQHPEWTHGKWEQNFRFYFKQLLSCVCLRVFFVSFDSTDSYQW